ncbi:Crp/Fnr family transcriptional regulator [Paenibacillus xylanilyticus]|uniref:Crp/Fnr family transcriptional regulator n=1 Tax=Paenibacillus xylanilyticus TaxID=248903 RepID=A0A7Y6C2D5_9BACL|nr:Crp/Fnr family transcriptional regulator [Paenibacillus xylanilyticus]NUU78334.1 Crp/Fnr family transcriptional regulator [Paenibacillus xylanilyticus]
MMCDSQIKAPCFVKVPLFQHLAPEESTLLASLLQSRSYHKGEIVVKEGEGSAKLYMVHQGCVKLSKYAENGKEHIVRFLFPGDFFGHDALLHQKPYGVHAEVLEISTLCTLHRQDFDRLIDHNPMLAYHFLLAVSDLLEQSEDWNTALSLMNPEQRIAKLLLNFHTRNMETNGIKLPVFKKDMALLAGITPETLSRKLAILQSEGLLQVAGNVIHLLQLEELQQRIQ